MSFLISRIIFGMISNSQFSIGCFDFIKSGIFRKPKNAIVIIQWTRIVLIKEILLFFTLQAMLIKEFLECLVCIREVVFMTQKLIVVSSFISIRENLKGFSNLMKLYLGWLPMFFVLVWMPFGSQFLVGTFDFKKWSVLRNSQHSIVVLKKFLSRHEMYLLLLDL
jgi:hypothetical protein